MYIGCILTGVREVFPPPRKQLRCVFRHDYRTPQEDPLSNQIWSFFYGKMGVSKAGPLRKPDKRCHGFSVSIGEAHPLGFCRKYLGFSKDLEGMGCGGIGDDAEKFEMHLGNPTGS